MQKLNQSYLNLSPSELIQKSKIKLTILPDQASLHTHFARTIADEIKQNNHKGNPTRLILPVGPILQYPILADISNAERISWKNVFTFNMDEYCDWQGRLIPETHPLSFRNYMREKLFNQLDQDLRIPENQSYFPDPLHLDSVSQTIDRLGGIDTCYGGIGFHGHVAFNEPPVSRFYSVSIDEFKYSQTRVVDLCSDSIIMNSIRNAGGNSNDFPPKGITIGMKDILASKRIRMYCPGGAWQRYIVRISCLGKEDIDYPSTLLQGHDDYELIIDQETAMPPTMSLD
jgi:glucosamine-6-phosphate deaminase